MDGSRETYSAIDDKASWEAVPLSERWSAKSVYELLAQTAGAQAERPALSFQIRSGESDKAETLTWEQVRARTARAANLFRDLGVQEGDGNAQMQVVGQVEAALQEAIGGIETRRVEVVGPKVSGELVQQGALAVGLAVFFMLIYIWLRFEWQFGLGAVLALMHDVFLTLGMFSLLGLEFNLSTVAAVLTIAGYSINDTVVVFDRIREDLRRYKTKPVVDLLNESINATLSRTLRAFGMAILGAEYLLRLVPPGTHDWRRFLKPHELARMMRHAGIGLTDTAGISYDPVSRGWRLSRDLSVNYLICGSRPA